MLVRPTGSSASLNVLVAAVLLGGVGRVLLLNAPTLADGVLLRLDEAVSLVAACALGPVWGAVTSLTATLGTGHPFSALLAVEALVVGWVVRAGWGPISSTTAFWVLVGGLAFSGVLPVPDVGFDVRLAWAKQVINGALSAAIAHVVLRLPWARWLHRDAGTGAPAVPLRTQFSDAIVPLCSIPVILLGLGLGRMYVAQLESEGTRDLERRADSVAAQLDAYVTAAEGDVRTLAGELSDQAPAAGALDRVTLHHAGSTAFLTMLVTDAAGVVVSASSRVASAQPTAVAISQSVADREYFRIPATTGRLHVTDGFQGRGLGVDPIVAVSAPYTSQAGVFGGVAQGALNLSVFGQWLARFVPESEASVVVLDRPGQVIASEGPDAPPLLSDGRGLPWIGATELNATGRFVSGAEDAATRRATHVAVRRALEARGWQVHVRRSLRAMQAPIVPFYQLTAAWLVAALIVATVLAGRIARGITQPLETLAHAAEAVGRGQAVASPPLAATAPAEVVSLQRELDAMVARLDESLALLDQKVRDRSAELAAATARSDTIFQAASDGLVVIDRSGRMLEVNDAFCRMVGDERRDLVDRPLADLMPTAELEGRRAVTAAMPARLESVLEPRDGAPVPVEIVLAAMPGGGGRAFASVRDISERRRAEADRLELEARLRQSQKMEAIGTLAGGIAHDFNNILTLIAGSAELAVFDLPGDHAARPLLEQIGRATSRAESLVRQILTFSRRRDEQREIVAVEPIVREAVGMLRSTLPAMIEIRTSIDRELPPIQADAVQLHQVLMNLGGNAAHAMREKGGVLTVEVQAVVRDAPSGGAGVRVSVSDTGTGMDQETVDRAFEPFFTTKGSGEGTGLGLAVVHGIVGAHGGTIDVQSEVGRGTTFTVWLPAATAGVAPAPPVPEVLPHGRGHRANILVVDDEPELVGLACKQLDRLGYTAQGCSGPLEALKALKDQPRRYDIVMSDLAMPKMSGIELAEQIRRDHHGIVVVLCSGRVTEEDRSRATKAGIAEILAKPFAREQLAAVMARSVGALDR
jgi:PAS domain S-box-containing protein